LEAMALSAASSKENDPATPGNASDPIVTPTVLIR
jgi:hypothetical protein